VVPMAEILLEEVNPNGNIQAVVESDDDVCYFYLFGAPDTKFEMRAVWFAIARGRRRPSKLNASGPEPRRGTRLAIVVILRAGPHLLRRICVSAGCRKATARRSMKKMRSWPSSPPGAASKGSTVTPATPSVTDPLRGSLTPTIF
jgi:hypothetical protein